MAGLPKETSFLLSTILYTDRTNDMKNTIFTALFLTATLSACSNFEAVDHSNPDANTEQSLESGDYAVFDLSNGNDVGLSSDALVMELERTELAVYEIDSREAAEANPNWVGYDNKHAVEKLKDLDLGSRLWYELSSQQGLAVAYVGMAPSNMLKLSQEVGHWVVPFQETEDVIYESELSKGIIEAMEKGVEYLYLPIDATSASDFVLKTIDYAKAEEIRVFDHKGSQL